MKRALNLRPKLVVPGHLDSKKNGPTARHWSATPARVSVVQVPRHFTFRAARRIGKKKSPLKTPYYSAAEVRAMMGVR